ncbi:MAG: DUF6797 domain-containing protein [Deltaproteobacteria bacterium]|nr:DUF6797 domain-containing protein [Deltaproteobacteria bacterium]
MLLSYVRLRAAGLCFRSLCLSVLALGACAKPTTSPAAAPAAINAPPAPNAAPPAQTELGRPQHDVEEEGWSPIQSDFPFQASAVTAPYPAGNTTNKSISVRLADGAACNFDTDLLRLSSAWTGKFLTATGVTFDTSHGGHPQVAGAVQFGTAPGPGWADERGSFADPRSIPFGPLPEKWARWDGLYTVGNDVVFAYTIHGTKINEWNSVAKQDANVAFVRTLSLAPISKPLTTRLFDLQKPGAARGEGLERSFDDERGTTHVMVVGAPAGAAIKEAGDGRIVLSLPKTKAPSLLKIITAFAPQGKGPQSIASLAGGAAQMPAFTQGGQAHWPKPIVTKGSLGTSSGAYVVDRITTPYPGVYKGAPEDWKDNVFHRRIMIAGVDFFSDGTRAAVSTWEGDVWVVSGIDADLDKLEWRRFASGLYEPLGLKIVKDQVYVTGRDQITRLSDLNNDGEADRYENFNNQITNSPGFHEFQFDLQTDKQGNFYTAKAGPVRSGGRGFGGGGGNGTVTPMAGALHKISADGKKRTIVATGFRAPNGIGVGPNGELTTGDNEGTWMPACPINWVQPGGFYGVEDLAHKKPLPAHDKPLTWLPKSYDNSGGGQVWVTSDKWGPLKGELLHLSYGRASIYRVLKEKVGKQMQGGVVRLVGGADAAQLTGEPVKLTSSAMRGRFNEKDGQLYVVGLSGWQSDAVSLTGFDRIRYTGKEVHSVVGLKVTSAGVHLTFDHPLDPTTVVAQNFSGERWNYHRTQDYGSPEFSVDEPERRGHDRLDVYGAILSKDGRTVTVQIDDLRPVDQMLLKFKLKAADGAAITQSVVHTIHVVPADPSARGNTRVAARGKPGLNLTLKSGSGSDITVAQGVQLFVGKGRAASAFTQPGAFEATWEGTLTSDQAGDYVLAVDASGPMEVTVKGAVVLSTTAAGLTRSKPVALTGQPLPVRVKFVAAGGRDEHARLLWAASNTEKPGSEALEPVPPNAFRHEVLPQIAESARLRSSRELFIENRCIRCHAGTMPAGASPELTMDAPSLDGIGSRVNRGWLREWISNPKGYRASASMPRLFAKDAKDDKDAVAAYLSTLRDSKFDKEREALAAEVDARLAREKTSNEKLDGTLMTTYLCGGCHTDMGNAADDGRLSLGAVGQKYPKGAVAAYLQNPAAHYAWNPMPNFRLSRAEAVELEITITRMGWKTQPQDYKDTPEKLARGKQLVQEKGCLSCHQMGNEKNRGKTLNLIAGAKGSGGSCLDGTSGVDYGFSAAQAESLKTFVSTKLATVTNYAPAEASAYEASKLRCTGCHGTYDGFPSLDNVGAKLRPEWMAQFIAGNVAYKPRGEKHPDGHAWLPARMPGFGPRANVIAEGLAAQAGFGPTSAPLGPVNKELAQVGAQLVSADGGFSCIGCHGIGSKAATQVFEAEGVNLAYAADRLRPEFFRRWVRNPLKIDPQTKMPTYFDEAGASPIEVLGGDGEKQIDAMWNFARTLNAK